MNLLLDTHVLLWSLVEPERLKPEWVGHITEPSNTVWVSAIALWEIGINASLGKLTVPTDLMEHLTAMDFQMLAFKPKHAMAAGALPLHHRDPFDRGLLAQATVEGFTLVTADRSFRAYASIVELLA